MVTADRNAYGALDWRIERIMCSPGWSTLVTRAVSGEAFIIAQIPRRCLNIAARGLRSGGCIAPSNYGVTASARG